MNDLDAQAIRLHGELGRFRRRLLLVAFVRAFPVAAAVALGAALLIARIVPLQFVGVLAVAAFCGFGALSVAALVAYRRTGGVVRVAATLDRRFGFADRLTTAVQFAGHADGISTLVAADADAALRRRRPQDVAFEAPRHLSWMLAAAAVVMVMFAVTATSSSESDATNPSRGVLGDAASASPSTGKRALASTAAPASLAAAATQQQATDAAARRDGASASRSNDAANSDTSARHQTTNRSVEQPTDRGEPRRRLSAATPSSSAEPNGANVGHPANQRGSAGANSGSGNQSRAARGDSGGGVGATAVRSTTTSAGGVKGSSADPTRPPDNEQLAVSSRVAVTPSVAWDRAESAIQRDHLPLQLRTYVRDYLAAIRSGGLP